MKAKYFRKIVLLIFILLLTFVVSCQNSQPTYHESSDENKEIEIWHIWTTDTDANKMTFEAAFDKVKENYPNVTFHVVARETETYKIRIKTSLAANTAPDIFYTWGNGYSQSFIDSGKVANLDQYYDEHLSNRLSKQHLNYQMYDGSLYGLPFMQSYAVLFVNEEIFERYDLPLPTDYDNLKYISYELNKKDILPLAVAGAELWPFMFQYASLALREVGADTVQKTLEGKLSFNQKGFIDAGYKLQELESLGLYGDNYMYMGYEKAADMFKNGEAAMFYMGSWALGGFNNSTAIKNDIKVMPFPGIGKEFDGAFLGGTVDCFMVNENTKDKELAFSVASMMAESMSEIGAQVGMGLPVWNKGEPKLEKNEGQSEEDYQIISELYDDIIDITANPDGTVLWWDTFFGSKGPECNELIIRMLTNKITPEQFVVLMDELVRRNE